MGWLIAALTIAIGAGVGVLWVRRRARPTSGVAVAGDLGERVTRAATRFAKAAPWRPASSPDAPEVAAAIEAALIAREPKRALELAETALASHDGASSRMWLAWALCANGQPTAARDQLARLAKPTASNPLREYLAARAEHLEFEHAVGAVGAMPPLVTTGDLAVVTLARGRGGAAWFTGASELQLSAGEVKAAIAEHREITARCLEHGLAALAAEPGFVDAAYLVARLAVKAGLIEPAQAMFDAVASAMVGRPDAEAFERDRRDLADPTAAVANARLRPPAPTAKRSRSLKVLS